MTERTDRSAPTVAITDRTDADGSPREPTGPTEVRRSADRSADGSAN